MSRATLQFWMLGLAAFLALAGTLPVNIAADELPRAASAASKPGDSPRPPIQYRRLYVPADKMEAWPRDGEKLIPIEARDFDAWIDSANDSATAKETRVAINSAEYSARLETDGQLYGAGRWAIVLRGEKPAFLPLGDTSLILRDQHWQDTPSRPARIGTWGQNDRGPSRFGLEVVRSGTFEFDWHIPTRSADDPIDIPWIVPAANSARLTLDLPEGKQPRIEGGVVLESAVRAPDGKTRDKPQRRWVIAFNPSKSASLRIVSADRKPSEPASPTVLHEDVSYHIGPLGLEMTAKWNLRGPSDQKRELAVTVPAGLQLSSVMSGASELTWRLFRDDSTPTDTALIDLPKSDSSKPLQILLTAWQPLAAGAPWRLPRLRPEGVFWSSGKFELSVAATYELKHLNLTDCIETGVGQLHAGEDSPETHSFEAYSSSAALEINLAERQADATIRAGSSLALADPNLNGRLVTQLSVSHGATHQLVGNVAPGWIIEALETIPADAMTQWLIDRNGDEKKIEIQLSRASSAAQNVTVIVTARLQRFNLTERLSAETMRIVRWAGATTARHLLTFQSNEPYAIVPVGKLSEVAADAIDANDRALLDSTTDNKVYDIADASANAGLQFAVRRGQFAADIDVEVSYENDVLRQEYRLTAKPASGPIDRMLVCATGALGDGTRWIDKTTSAPVAADRLAANDPQRASLPKETEVWLLRFSQPTTRPIELVASVSIKRPGHALVPLLFLPEATQQDARILVRSRNPSALWLEPIHLQTIPLPLSTSSLSEPDSLPPVCSAYRYQPTDCRDPALAPKLSATANPEIKTIPLVARHIEFESYLWPDGSGAHCASYQLDNHGAAEIKLALPADARFVSASLDGESLDIAKPTDTSQPLVIRLPIQNRPTKLALYLNTRGPPLTAGRELTPPSVLNQLPFVAGDWTIWLPEEYSATGAGLSTAAPKFNWRERLFGVLGRPIGSQPFNPFRLADGAALVNGGADGNVSGSTIDASEGQSTVQKPDQNKMAIANPSTAMGIPAAGWRNYHESFVGSGPAPIVVLHAPAITAWTVALLLTCFLCGRWLWRFQPGAFVVVLAAAAALGLFLPIAYANLASGAVLGLLFSLIADWPRRSISADESLRRPRPSSAVAVALVIAFAIGLTKLGHAASPPNNAPRDASLSKIYRLLIPTDEQGHPTGAKYYVSDDFLRVLLAASADSNQNLGQWLLNDVAFTGELAEKPEQKDVVAGNWTMSFAIETLARDTTVVLPLIRSEADWNATAMLDGVPSPLEWRDAGRSCAIQIPEPGRYSLSLSCVPKTKTSDGLNQIDLAVPPTRGAKIELRYPESASSVTIANVSILTPLSRSAKNLSGELDRTNRLDVRWSRSDKLENGASGFTLTEMRWLHVMSTELEITAKYILEGGARRPESIAVAYDDRWTLLTTEKSLNAKIAVAGTSGQHTIRIPISTQASDRQEITLRWRLVDPPALGNLRLPPIELTSLSHSKRWLAISADSKLNCEIADASATESTANEFFAKWGDADANDPPQTVVSNFDARRAADLAIRPRETEPIVDESLNASAGLTALRVIYEARMTPGIPGEYRTKLSVPADLSIDEIAVTEADQQIPLRWSRMSANRVSVFFSQQITKPYRLVLNGTTPIDANGKALLPHISALATEDATQKIRLYRSDDVQVDVEGLPSTADPKLELPGPPPSQWSARPVATCYLESGAATARITVKPIKFKITGDSFTSLSRENGAWWVNYRCQLSVEDGDLDILRLRIPSTCTGPFDAQSTPSVTSEFKPLDDQMGMLSIRFATTVAKGGSVDLRIRSPLKAPSGMTISVPAIVVESLSSGRRYISVPDSVDSQAVTWSEAGVRPATLPTKLRNASTPLVSAKCVEVVGEPFQVASRSSAAPGLLPQIRLADTTVIADDLGAQRITARLILAPHGLTDCTLQLPPSQSLVTVELEGRPAVTHQLDQSQWQLALGATQLPQSIEIISRLPASDTDDGITQLQRPALLARGAPIAAEISLWSFAHPRNSASRVVSGADQVGAVDQASLRFDRLVSIAEAARATAAELPPPDGYNWFQPWAKLLTATRAQTQLVAAAPQPERQESQVSHTAEDQIGQAVGRLDKWLDSCRKSLIGPNSETAPLPSATSNLPTTTQQGIPTANEWTYYVAEGGNDRLTLQLQPLGPTASQIRLIGLLMISALLIAAIWLMRRPAAIDALCRWPHAYGVLVGIVYWAWMWPSWIGILIAAASVWLALRFDWPGRSLRTEASTVLRTTRSNQSA